MYRAKLWAKKFAYRKLFGWNPVSCFSFQCACGLEAILPIPKPGTVIAFPCPECSGKHRMIWLRDYWQTSSIFNDEKVKFEPINLPGHPRVTKAP